MSNRVTLRLNVFFHEMTSWARTLPDFFIVGTSYCGKTLLYNYLIQHKSILKNLREETGYFFDNYDRGFNWYKSNFPFSFTKNLYKLFFGETSRVGETVNIPFVIVPERIAKIIHKPKIIVVLRNPVERTYSRYLAMVREGIETLSFEDAINKEDRWTGEKKEMMENKAYFKNNRKVSRYLSGSIYVDDLERWAQFFSKNDMLILKSEDLFNDTLKTVNQSLEFLGLSQLKNLKNFSHYYEKNAKKIDPKIKQDLNEFFQPYNEKLYKFFGKDLGWENGD